MYVLWVAELVLWNALFAPVEVEAGVIVTLSPRVAVFPNWSLRVAVMSADSVPAVEELVADVKAMWSGAAGLTVKVGGGWVGEGGGGGVVCE